MEQEIQDLKNMIADLQNRMYANEVAIQQSQQTAASGDFSNLKVFNTPLRIIAPISPQAGGKLALYIGSGNFGIYYGSGAPTISATLGSLYLRNDGSSTSTRAYINTNGSTTWTAITTVA